MREKYDEDERVEGRKSLVPEGRDGREKGRSPCKKGKSAEGRERKETNTMNIRGSKDAKARFQSGGMVRKRVGP